jgi:hypothetical protein
MRSRAFATVAIGMIVCHSLPLAAAEMRSDEIVKIAQAAIKRIGTVQGRYRTYFAKWNGPGVIKGPDGQGMFYDMRWLFDHQTRRAYYEGRRAGTFNGKKEYEDVRIAFDGKQLRTWGKQGNGGTIREVGGELRAWLAPNLFWGWNYGEMPDRDLADLLEGATLIECSGLPAGCRALRNDYQRGGEMDELTVWLDSNHGFLPKRIKVVRKDTGTTVRLTEIDEFYQTRDGIWVPVRGRDTLFALMEIRGLPDGLTLDQVEKLPKPEREAIRSKLTFKTESLGLGTQTYVLDTDGLVINESIPASRFTFEYSEGAYVWNDFEKQGYKVGRFDDPAQQLKVSDRGGDRHFLLASALGGVLLCLVVVFVRRRMTKTSHT